MSTHIRLGFLTTKLIDQKRFGKLLGAIGHLIPGQMCGKVAYHLGDVGLNLLRAGILLANQRTIHRRLRRRWLGFHS